MPASCCAFGYSSRKKKGDCLSFYRVPFGTTTEKEKERRNLWIGAIKRDKWKETQVDNACICSLHFIFVLVLYTIALNDFSNMSLLIITNIL